MACCSYREPLHGYVYTVLHTRMPAWPELALVNAIGVGQRLGCKLSWKADGSEWTVGLAVVTQPCGCWRFTASEVSRTNTCLQAKITQKPVLVFMSINVSAQELQCGCLYYIWKKKNLQELKIYHLLFFCHYLNYIQGTELSLIKNILITNFSHLRTFFEAFISSYCSISPLSQCLLSQTG